MVPCRRRIRGTDRGRTCAGTWHGRVDRERGPQSRLGLRAGGRSSEGHLARGELLRDPRMGDVEGLAQRQQVAVAEAVGRVPLVVLALVEPVDRDLVPGPLAVVV